MANAASEPDCSNCDKSNSETNDSSSYYDHDKLLTSMVYTNDLIMRKVITHVPALSDRLNIELSSRRLRSVSLKVGYRDIANTNNVLDMNFMNMKPTLTISVAGNVVSSYALTSNDRLVKDSNEQPQDLLLKMSNLISRFGKQITDIRIGSIPDCDRLFQILIDHQLVLNRNITDLFDDLRAVKSLTIRNCCLVTSLIQHWSSGESLFMRRLKNLCFHSIWFEQAADCERFVEIIPRNIRHLYLSDCSSDTIDHILSRVQKHSILKSIFVAINHRTFRTGQSAETLLKNISEHTKEIHLCVCWASRFSQFINTRNLLRFFPTVSYYGKVTKLDVDFGLFKSINSKAFIKLIKNFNRLENLHTLRLDGCISTDDDLSAVNEALIYAFTDMPSLTELSILNMLKIANELNMRTLYSHLPINLKNFALCNIQVFTDECCAIIANQCKKLESTYIVNVQSFSPTTVAVLLDGCKSLRRLAFRRVGSIQASTYCKLSEKKFSSKLEAVILGGNRVMLNSETEESLRQSYHNFCLIKNLTHWTSCEYHMWNMRSAYDELLNSASFANCPNCGKDVSLFDDD